MNSSYDFNFRNGAGGAAAEENSEEGDGAEIGDDRDN